MAPRCAITPAKRDGMLRALRGGALYRDGREYDESVEREVDSLTCPHCGGLVPRGG